MKSFLIAFNQLNQINFSPSNGLALASLSSSTRTRKADESLNPYKLKKARISEENEPDNETDQNVDLKDGNYIEDCKSDLKD